MPFPRLWTHLRLSAEMASRPPDVLWIPSHVLPIVHPRRSVVTVHDLGYHYYPDAHTLRQRWYLEWSTRYHTRAAAHIVADSQATRDDLVRIYDADPGRITVAHLGLDPVLQPVRDPAELSRIRSKYGISSPYLLYVGTLQPRKNLVRLIEAHHVLCTAQYAPRDSGLHSQNLQLVLVGKRGWLYEDITVRIRALGLEDRVLVPGYVDDADLAALYSGASAFVMPSLYEGFCLPVLEAMACGTPVACSRSSSLPEVVGDAALVFDPHDVEEMAGTIARLLRDDELSADLVRRGLDRVRGFTWERCARQVLDVLEQIGAQQ
jgi:glycosyltransferase involved in cell wall biosynthesis